MINLMRGRADFEAMGGLYAAAENVKLKTVFIAGVNCGWLEPENAVPDDVVVYIHGGAFIYGSLRSHAAMVSHISQKLNRKVLMIDYRLAPEAPFPAGLEDCVKVIRTFFGEHPDVRFGIIGDSAGGNLTLSAQLKLKETKGPSPQYGIVISPWADLECKNASYGTNRMLDMILSHEFLSEAADMYAGGNPKSAPLLSPVNGDFAGCAPALVMCGTHEILEDDAIHLHRRMLDSGVDAELKMFKGQLHVWPFTDIGSAASQKALDDMAEFVAGHSRTAG